MHNIDPKRREHAVSNQKCWEAYVEGISKQCSVFGSELLELTNRRIFGFGFLLDFMSPSHSPLFGFAIEMM